MAKTQFVSEGPDRKGRTYIIEGTEKPGKIFSIKRFICQVQNQQTEEETQAVAKLLTDKLNA
jgi:hypothetical protein